MKTEPDTEAPDPVWNPGDFCSVQIFLHSFRLRKKLLCGMGHAPFRSQLVHFRPGQRDGSGDSQRFRDCLRILEVDLAIAEEDRIDAGRQSFDCLVGGAAGDRCALGCPVFGQKADIHRQISLFIANLKGYV